MILYDDAIIIKLKIILYYTLGEWMCVTPRCLRNFQIPQPTDVDPEN